MTLIRNLVLVLYLGLLFLKPSNAQFVTVPLENGLSITVSTGTATAPLQNLYTNPAATDVTMPDDSNVAVPLQFSFPFYGQSFTNSWMYSNGAVSFTGGNAPGGFCCSGADLTTLRDSRYNYSIMPLWTDLIATRDGKHYTLSTPTSTTYGWYNVNEYGSSSRSSFELSIDSGGGINTVFSGAVVSYHPVTSGMVGDIIKGEYYQYYYGNGINSGPFSWSLGTTPYDPCKDNPLSSPSCTGFSSALAAVAPVTIVSEPVVVTEPVSTTTAVVATIVAVTPIASTSTSTTTILATQPNAQQASKPGVSLSQIMKLVGTEQNRISSLEKSVVQTATDQATKSGEQAKALAESVNQAAVANSLQVQVLAGYSGTGTSSRQQQQDTSSTLSYSTGTTAMNSTSSNTSRFGTVVEPEAIQQESLSFGTRGVLVDYINDSNLKLTSMQETTLSTSTLKSAEANSLATGITIAAIAVVPVGYTAYSEQLTDSKFYDPKEIYRGQQPVDNIRLLRGLGSELKHQQMIQSQYK